jgi:iron complex outermembrane recepter protein
VSNIKFHRLLLASAAILAIPAQGWAQADTSAKPPAAPSAVQAAKASDAKSAKTAKAGSTQLADAGGTRVAAASAAPAAAVGDTQVVAAGDTQVAAADGVQVAAAGNRSSNTVETVIVTARHREENIQDVPESVQAISGDTLEQKGTIDLQSLIAQTPGLNSTGGNPRNFSVLIRGIGYAPTAADGLDNAIGVYINGVYQSRPGQVLQDLVDVDSFEVLRGPQGTLFGRNAAAGALNITTNAPSFTPSETFEVSAGNYSFFQGKAIVGGAITDNIAFRAVLYGTNSAGWLPTPFKVSFANAAAQKGIFAPTASDQTVTGGTGRYGGRLQFLINASDKLSINIDGDLELENDSSAGFSSGGGISTLYGPGNWGINTTAAQQATVTKTLGALSNLTAFGGVQNWIPAVNPNIDITNNQNATHTSNGGVSITANYDLDWANLTSISAWRLWRFNPPQDSDTSPVDILENEAISKSNQYSEELRLTSTEKGPVEWQVGAFLYYSMLKDHYVVHQYGTDTIPYYDAYQGSAVIPLSFRSQLTGAQIIENTHIQDQNEAAYGQATWHITDDLDLTGGVRYTNDRKSGGSPVDTSQLPQTLPAGVTNAQLNTFYKAIGAIFVNPGVSYTTPGFFTTGTASVPATAGYPLNLSTQSGNVSGSASLSYKITPDVTAYVAFSNGFQAGGLDLNNGSAAAGQGIINPSITDNYEAGVKTTLFDDRLVLDLTAYNEVLYGFQTSISYLLPNGTSYRGATNAGNIRSRGIEWNADASLGDGIKLTVDGAYNDSIYQYAPSLPAPAELSYNGVANVNATGQTAPFAPKLSVSVTPSWNYQIGAHENFYTYAQYSYTSDYSTGVTQSIYTQVPGQYNLNLRAGVQLEDGRYDVSVYANNATNQKNIASQALLAAPSGVGVTAYLGQTVSYNPPAFYGITLRAKF